MSDNLLVTEEGNPTPVHVGDAANKALRVNVVAGGAASNGLTDAQLRATPVPVSGSFSATTTAHATAAAPTLIEGTDNALSADLSGNLRTLATATTAATATAANPTYVEGSTSALSQDLSGHLRTTALTDTQLRASAVPVSAASLPLPSNAAKETGGNLDSLVAKDFATQTTLALIKAKTDNLDVALSTRTKPGDTQLVDGSAHTQPVSGTFWQVTQPVSATALPLPSNAAQETGGALATIVARTPALGTAATAASSPVNIASDQNVPIRVREDASLTLVDPGDATNKAIRVNVVASAGSTTFFGITESSTGDGSTATLTLGHTPTDEPRVFVDRIRQVLNTDYTRSGAVITWIVVPGSGAPIQVDYTWSLASATLASTLVVDVNGHVLPTGDAAARSIHVTVDSASTDTTLAGTLKTQPLEKTGYNSVSLQRRSAELTLLVALDQQRLSLRTRQDERISPAYQTRGQR